MVGFADPVTFSMLVILLFALTVVIMALTSKYLKYSKLQLDIVKNCQRA